MAMHSMVCSWQSSSVLDKIEFADGWLFHHAHLTPETMDTCDSWVCACGKLLIVIDNAVQDCARCKYNG